jgi:hypothetical protein
MSDTTCPDETEAALLALADPLRWEDDGINGMVHIEQGTYYAAAHWLNDGDSEDGDISHYEASYRFKAADGRILLDTCDEEHATFKAACYACARHALTGKWE